MTTKLILVSFGISVLFVLLIKYTTEKEKKSGSNDKEENSEEIEDSQPFEFINTSNMVLQSSPKTEDYTISPRNNLMSRYIRSK